MGRLCAVKRLAPKATGVESFLLPLTINVFLLAKSFCNKFKFGYLNPLSFRLLHNYLHRMGKGKQILFVSD